jgi:hypothetical protein
MQRLRVSASELLRDLGSHQVFFGFEACKSGHFGREQTVVGSVPHKRHSDTIE